MEIVYKTKGPGVIMSKLVDVEYAWKPYRCAHCCVFGLEIEKCRLTPKEVEDKNAVKETEQVDDGFRPAQNRKMRNEENNKRSDENNQSMGNKSKILQQRQYTNKYQYRKKQDSKLNEKHNKDKGKEKSRENDTDKKKKYDVGINKCLKGSRMK